MIPAVMESIYIAQVCNMTPSLSPRTICIHNRAYRDERTHSYELACWPLFHKVSEKHPSGQNFKHVLSFFQAPTWAYLACAIGLFIYQSLDAIDGKQARRTNSSTPLGELFDHGCDSLSTGLLTFVYANNTVSYYITLRSTALFY